MQLGITSDSNEYIREANGVMDQRDKCAQARIDLKEKFYNIPYGPALNKKSDEQHLQDTLEAVRKIKKMGSMSEKITPDILIAALRDERLKVNQLTLSFSNKVDAESAIFRMKCRDETSYSNGGKTVTCSKYCGEQNQSGKHYRFSCRSDSAFLLNTLNKVKIKNRIKSGIVEANLDYTVDVMSNSNESIVRIRQNGESNQEIIRLDGLSPDFTNEIFQGHLNELDDENHEEVFGETRHSGRKVSFDHGTNTLMVDCNESPSNGFINSDFLGAIEDSNKIECDFKFDE